MTSYSSNRVQEIIESNVEKRTKDVYVPQGGKKMIVFVDDLNILSYNLLVIYLTKVKYAS